MGDRIICAKDHKLGACQDFGIPLARMKRGETLEQAEDRLRKLQQENDRLKGELRRAKKQD